MNILSLFTLFLAIATFLLAGAAFCAIWQNHLLQKRERKERLLNEIIEWARESYKLFYDMQQFYSPESNVEIEELEKSLTLLWAEKDAMVSTAKYVDVELTKLVDLVKDRLDNYWKNKGSWIPQVVKETENELEALFATLFKKASETKTNLKL